GDVLRQRRPVPGDERGGEEELAVVAEVPDVRAEDHRQSCGDQKQGRHPDRAVLPRVPAAAAYPALPDVAVERDRVPSEGEEQDRAGAERKEDGEERADADVDRPGGEVRTGALRRPGDELLHLRGGGVDAHAASASAAPTIRRPISSATPGPFDTVPTMRPRESTAMRSPMSSSSSRSV